MSIESPMGGWLPIAGSTVFIFPDADIHVRGHVESYF